MKENFFDDLEPEFDFDELIGLNDNDNIETTCLNCRFTENVPSFIYDECSRKKYHFKLGKKVSTLYCGRCQKETAVPSSFLKN